MSDGHELEWDEANTGHLARHDVTPEEFEQALNHPRLEEEQFTSGGERRVWALGRTDTGH